MNETTEVLEVDLEVARLTQMLKLGHFAIRAKSAETWSGFTEALAQARDRKTKLAYIGSWALGKVGVDFFDLYSRRYLREGRNLVGGGYETLLIKKDDSEMLDKVFFQSFTRQGINPKDQHRKLNDHYEILNMHLGNRVVDTSIVFERPPIANCSRIELPIAVQPEITGVIAHLDYVVEHPEDFKQLLSEPILKGDLNDLIVGTEAIISSTDHITDFFGRGNILIHSAREQVRATLVDTSMVSRNIGPEQESYYQTSLAMVEATKDLLH